MGSAEQTKPAKNFFKRFKKPGKNMFWAWIAYQTVKGTLTTSLIWIPLLYAWFYHS
jgi:hypothetical protein